MPRNVTYRLEEPDIALIDAWADALGMSKTDVIRLGIGTLGNLIRVAQADATAALEVIRERYGADAEVSIWVTPDKDGEPVAHVQVDRREPSDLSARAMKSRHGDAVLVFLDLSDHYAELQVPIGDDALWVRPRFPVGKLPWPPQNYRIVLSVKDLAPTVPAEVSSRLEKVEA
jgi:hypothetical protein